MQGPAARMRPSSRRRRRGTSGAIYVEFLLCIVPVFVLFVCTLQLGLVASAKLVVRHAAASGARSAVVVLQDDPKYYAGAPRGQLDNGQAEATGALGGFVGSLIGSEVGLLNAGHAGAGARLQDIRAAASFPLAVLSPSLLWLVKQSPEDIRSALEASAALRFATGMAIYNRALAIVTLRAAEGSSKVVSYVPPGTPDDPQPVTVHVTYFYSCSIPIARSLVCKSGIQLLGLEPKRRELGGIVGDLGPGTSADDLGHATERLSRFARGHRGSNKQAAELFAELMHSEQPALGLTMLFAGRYVPLQAAATLPNQSAGYER